MNLTQTGKLPIGIVIEGVRHQDFEMRPPTVGDNIEVAIELGGESPLKFTTAIYARQLTKLGTLPPERITLDLVTALHPLDWSALEAADGELGKKLKLGGLPLDGGPTAEPSSPATA